MSAVLESQRGSLAAYADPLRDARAHADRITAKLEAGLRSEVNNSLIIVNFFHKIQNFRQISDLFSQI